MKNQITERPYSKDLFLLLSLALVLSLQNAWVPGFFADGYLYASFGKNAAELGHWLVPHFNDYAYSEFFHHTPFVFILEGLFFKVFGASYITARLFASLWYIAIVFIFYKYFSKRKDQAFFWVTFFFLSIPPLFKKVRFPNTDLPLMFFMLLSLFAFFKALEDKKLWFLNGLFFGLCLLIKGPMAAFIPIGQLLALFWLKRLNDLKSLYPWIGLALGFIIFSIWPASLYLANKAYIFEKWVEFTFIETIAEARGEASPIYTYVLFLLKQALPWFLLALFGIYKAIKNKSNFFLIMATYFLTILTLLSFAKFKYSNYLIPLYPFMGALAGYGFINLISEQKLKKIKLITFFLIPIATLTLLIFPLSNKLKREAGIHKLFEVLKQSNSVPDKLYVKKGSYGFWELSGKLTFDGHKTRVYILDNISEEVLKCKSCLILSRDEVDEDLSLRKLYILEREGVSIYGPTKDNSSTVPLSF